MKYLKDFEIQDWINLVEKNSDLENILFDRAVDNAWFCIDEYLQNCIGCDYSIDFCGYSFFKINDIPNCIGWLEELDKNMPLLSDEEMNLAKKLYDKYGLLDHVEYETNARQKDIDRLTDIVESLQKELEDAILKRLKSEYDCCYDNKWLTEFLDDVLYDVDYDNTYMKENGDLITYNPGYYVPKQIVGGYYQPGFYEEIDF